MSSADDFAVALPWAQGIVDRLRGKAIINANADGLNDEAADVLTYQGIPRNAASFISSITHPPEIQRSSALSLS